MPRSAHPFLSQLTRQFLTVPVDTANAFSHFVFVRDAAVHVSIQRVDQSVLSPVDVGVSQLTIRV